MKKLLLVRHGQTVNNVGRKIQGHLDSPLSDLGWKQVRALAERLRNEHIDVILSSDLGRARSTTEAIAAFHDASVLFLTELRERSWGSFDGKLVSEYMEACNASGVPHAEFTPPGGENLYNLKERCEKVLAEATLLYAEKTVLVSAHHSVNRCLVSLLLGKPFSEWRTIDQDNTCLNVFDFDEEGKVKAHFLNCTKHLDEGGGVAGSAAQG